MDFAWPFAQTWFNKQEGRVRRIKAGKEINDNLLSQNIGGGQL